MLDGIRSTTLTVPDLPAAADWYARVLDAAPLPDWTGQGVTFLLNGYQLTLQPGESQGGSTTVFWSVDALDVELARLTAMGARLAEGPVQIDAYSRQAIVFDPCGNRLGLIERDAPDERRARSQRVAERVALRNVRGLLDALENEDAEARQGRRVLWTAIALAVVGTGALIYGILPEPAVREDQLLRAPVQFQRK